MLPLVMVDSGHQISNGHVDYYNTYKAMVEDELVRLAQAEIEAQCQRIGDTLHFDIQLTNLSGVTLSGSSNSATVHAIVYEDAHVGVTDRIVRAAVSTSIFPALAHGETMTFTLETELSGVDWDKIHSVVLADYRPGGSSGAYDLLQAAFAVIALPNRAPYTPRNPVPADRATGVPITQILQWQGGDPDGDVVTYTVDFGTSEPPPLATITTLTNYTPANIVADTTYYWAITATDGISRSVGPLWQFATADRFIYLPLVMRQSS